MKITKANFVTDNKTNIVYLSSLINTKSGNLDLEVRSKLPHLIKTFAKDVEMLYNTMDVWVRDFMPIQLTKNVVLNYIYKPDYLTDYPECVTNWQIHDVHTQKQIAKDERWEYEIIQMPLILDGGNVIKAVINDKPCMILCEKILNENNLSWEDFDIWWNRWWAKNFDGTEMEYVLLPWEGHINNPIGHADGMVRYIKENKVLMTNYHDYDERYEDCHGALMRSKLEEIGFEVIELTYNDKFNYHTDKMYRMLFDHTWSYINFLQVGKKILIPSLGYPNLDESAKAQISDAFEGYEVCLMDLDMTPIIAGIKTSNSGGALNCLTWTTMK